MGGIVCRELAGGVVDWLRPKRCLRLEFLGGCSRKPEAAIEGSKVGRGTSRSVGRGWVVVGRFVSFVVVR